MSHELLLRTPPGVDNPVQKKGRLISTMIVALEHGIYQVLAQRDTREKQQNRADKDFLFAINSDVLSTRVQSLLRVWDLWVATKTEKNPPISCSNLQNFILGQNMQMDTGCPPSSVRAQTIVEGSTTPSLLSRVLKHAGAATLIGTTNTRESRMNCVDGIKARGWP